MNWNWWNLSANFYKEMQSIFVVFARIYVIRIIERRLPFLLSLIRLEWITGIVAATLITTNWAPFDEYKLNFAQFALCRRETVCKCVCVCVIGLTSRWPFQLNFKASRLQLDEPYLWLISIDSIKWLKTVLSCHKLMLLIFANTRALSHSQNYRKLRIMAD